jgi:hypothetical protein
MGNTTFLGPGLTIDTTKPIQVVTQFISSDGTANGDLVEIRRKFVQSQYRARSCVNRGSFWSACRRYRVRQHLHEHPRHLACFQLAHGRYVPAAEDRKRERHQACPDADKVPRLSVTRTTSRRLVA